MANKEETQNTDIIFRGTDGNECEAFIVAIRDLAFTKDKDEDLKWIHQALIVTFIRATEIHLIACFDCSASKLSVDLRPDNHSGFYRLGSTSLTEDPISMYGWGQHFFSNVWRISLDGTLSATLPNMVSDPQKTDYYLPSECHPTTTVYVEISGMSISFVKDHTTPRASHPHSGTPIVRAVSLRL